MEYAPHAPSFFNRDRFVLSNGHTCLFQYIFLHLTGYEAMTLDQLKSYHSSKIDSLCPGHPEIEIDGIEVTTGPLGQGVANAVGMAMATKHLQACYNKPGFKVVSNHTWCMVGDACLQEGVALEAISLAGHLQLNNLTIIYDNNQVTCDGSVDMTNTEDVNMKMAATGWNVIVVENGCYDVHGIVTALLRSKNSTKPTFINIKTVIGLDTALAGTSLAHGDAFGFEDVARLKQQYGFDPDERFVIPKAVKVFFASCTSWGLKFVGEWKTLLKHYSTAHPKLAAEFRNRLEGNLPEDWEKHIPKSFTSSPTASRISSGLVFDTVFEKVNSFMVGSADLSDDVEINYDGMIDFQRPNLKTQCGLNGAYVGRYIRYGVREHAMVAIANGIAAYHPNTIIPVASS
jgi:dihydroxyacetone synthase